MCGPAVATPSVQKALKAALMQRGGQGVRFSEYFKSDQGIADQEDLQHVESATEWTASVHTLHMSAPVITYVFKVPHNGLLRYIL